MPARPLATRRATLVGLGAGVLLTTGCELDDLDPRPVPPVGGATPSDGSRDTGDLADTDTDTDTEIVDAAVASLVATLGVVESVRGSDPALRRAVGDLDRLHRAHLAELDAGLDSGRDGTSADGPSPDTLGSPGAVGRPGRRALLAQEQAHRATLADLAGRASSGALAATLASMSAAVAQRVATLPASRPDGGAA